jgi:hypothetical protein
MVGDGINVVRASPTPPCGLARRHGTDPAVAAIDGARDHALVRIATRAHSSARALRHLSSSRSLARVFARIVIDPENPALGLQTRPTPTSPAKTTLAPHVFFQTTR